MQIHIPITNGVNTSSPENQPVSLDEATFRTLNSVYFNKCLSSYGMIKDDGNHWWTANGDDVTWTSDGRVFQNGQLKTTITDNVSKPVKGRWVVDPMGQIIEYELDPNAVRQIPVHGHGTAVSVSANNIATWNGITWTINGNPHYFYNSGTLYECYQGLNNNRHYNGTSWISNYVKYICWGGGNLCISYSTSSYIGSGTVIYEEFNIYGTREKQVIANISGNVYQRISAPGIEMMIIQGSSSWSCIYTNDQGTAVTNTPQQRSGSIIWRSQFWNLWRRDTRIAYSNDSQACGLSYGFSAVTPVLDDYFIQTGWEWTLADDYLIRHHQPDIIPESANSYMTRIGDVIISKTISKQRAVNLNFISPNILTVPTTGTNTSIINLGFSNNSALELNNDQSTGGIAPISSFTCIGTPSLTTLGPGLGGSQIGTAIGDFYSGINSDPIVYRWSTDTGTTSYIKEILIDTTFYNTNDPIIPIPINVSYGKTRSNQIIVQWGEEWSTICISIDSKSILGSLLSSVIYDMKNIFDLKSITYCVDDHSLFMVNKSGSSVLSLQFMASIDGMKFIGSSTSEALFYSEFDKSLKYFAGDLQFNTVFEISDYGSVIDGIYHQESSSYLLLTTKELLILRNNQISTTGIKGKMVSGTKDHIVVYDSSGDTRITFINPSAPYQIKSSFLSLDKFIWCRWNFIMIRLNKISKQSEDVNINIYYQTQGGNETKSFDISTDYKAYDFYNAKIPLGVTGSAIAIEIKSNDPLSVSDILLDFEPVGNSPAELRGQSKWT